MRTRLLPIGLMGLMGLMGVMGGCAHVATHYAAPDSTPMREAATRLSSDVKEAKASALAASNAVGAAKTASDRESAALALLTPKVAELEQLGPVGLKPAIEAIRAEVEDVRTDHEEVVNDLADAQAKQGTLGGVLEKANADDNDYKAKEAEYLPQVDALAAKANASEQGWAKDSKSLLWYRVHWFLGWIVMGLGVLACGFLAFLKLTGKLAGSAAAVAAKI